MDRGETQLFLGVLLMLSLFLNESWVLGNQPDSSDGVLYGILSFVFIIFLLESAILSVVQPHYFLGFFFWMDVLGTISIIFDIGWFADSLFGDKGNSTSILRATRAAKLGARYGRLMRILKLMKFVKFLPCMASDQEEKPEPTLTAVRKVSNTLTNVLSQRVAGLVMLLVIVIPFLNYDTPAYDSSSLAWVRNVKLIAKDANANGALMTSVIDKFENFYRFKDQKLQRVLVTSPDPAKCVSQTFFPTTDIRSSNLLTVESDFEVAGTIYVVSAVMDITIPHKMDSLFGILIIILVIFVLVFFSASFQNAVDSLMVVPLEKIMTALRNSATIMLKSMKAASQEDEAGKKAEGEDDDDEDGELETQMLEKMVEKLVKIVGHMSGGSQLLAEQDKNVDSATANWLSSTYAQSNVITKQNTSALQEEGSHLKRLSALSDASLAVTVDVLNSWDFDVLELNGDQLSDIFIYLFNILNIVDEFKVPLPVLKTFLMDISGKYQPNTYHNYQHGYDVAHTVYQLMIIPRLNVVFSHIEFFSLLVAAVAHDVGHPGVNNLYLVNSKNELALRHNDRSPLENMHCSLLYEVLAKDKTNIFVNLTEGQWRESRKVILACILGTDMSQHFDQISKLQLFFEVNGEDTGKFCSGIKDNIDVLAEEKSRMFILEICLHCADISNPYKPFKICAKWAELIVEEFSRQGDREKSEGLTVSPMMDRATIMICTMQMGFIEFVVAPLIIAFINVFPPHFQIGINMADNYCAWADQRKGEIQKDDKITNKEEEIKKLEERQSKFKGRLNFCNDLVNKPRRGSAVINKDEFAVLESKIKSSSIAK